jgi:hypothetical protein
MMKRLFAPILLVLAFLLVPIMGSAPVQSQTLTPQTAILCNKVAPSGTLTAGTVQSIVGVAGKAIYICGFSYEGLAGGSIQLVYGTGASCTSPTNLTGVYTVAANGNVTDHIDYAWNVSAFGQSLCAIVTGTNSVVLQVYYAQF